MPDGQQRIPGDGGTDRALLRFLTCGSVDDGKSTLIGRLLYDADADPGRPARSVASANSRRFGTTGDDIDFSLLLDGLEDERQQRITIDVAYRYFATRQARLHRRRHAGPRAVHPQHGDRRLDRRSRRAAGRCPQGRAAADQAAFADLLAARHPPHRARGQQARSRRIRPRRVRHASPRRYARFAAESRLRFAADDPDLGAPRRQPDRALGPHAVVSAARRLLDHLETDRRREDAADEQPFRFPVQWVNRPNLEFRGFSGTVAAGSVAPGDPVRVMGSARASRVKEIVTFDGPLARAAAGDAVTLTFEDEIDISRGDMLVGRTPPRANSPTSSPRIWSG